MSNINISDKSTGDLHTAAEYNQVKDFINSPEANLGALNPASISFDTDGYYSAYTQTGTITFTINGSVVSGVCQIFKLTADGSNNIGFDANFESSAIFGHTAGSPLAAGDYWVYFLAVAGKIHVTIKAAV